MSNMLDALKASGFALSEEAEKEAELNQSSSSADFKAFLPFSVDTFAANEFKRYSKSELNNTLLDESAYAGGDSAMEEYKKEILKKKRADEDSNLLMDSEYSFLADISADDSPYPFDKLLDEMAIKVLNRYKDKVRVVSKFNPDSIILFHPYLFHIEYMKYRKRLHFEIKSLEISRLAEEEREKLMESNMKTSDRWQRLRELRSKDGFLTELIEKSPYIPLIIDDDTYKNYDKKIPAKVLLGKDIRGYEDYEERLKPWFEQGGVINPNVWYICRIRQDGGMYLQRDLYRSPRKTDTKNII